MDVESDENEAGVRQKKRRLRKKKKKPVAGNQADIERELLMAKAYGALSSV